jgi:hypothetical protein
MSEEAPTRPARRPVPWGVLASLLLHAGLVLALLTLPPPRQSEPAAIRAVTVEIVAPPPAMRPPPPATEPGPRVEPEPPTRPAAAPTLSVPPLPDPAPSRPSEPGMVKPSRMLSGRELADPRNRAARREMSRMAPEERAIQLCNVEAMAQIAAAKAALRPDVVVAYAMADVVVAGDTLVADGAAFRSRRNWYAVRFRCALRPDHAEVTDFEFRVGDAIPKRLWADHALTDDDGPLD